VTLLLALNIALQVWDGLATYYGLSHGVHEGNPLLRSCMEYWDVGVTLVGAAIVQRGQVLVWFPEGERSPSGTLQRFRPGIGLVLSAQPAPVVPVYIAGAFDALPRGRWWPRIRPITVTFGEPVDPRELERRGEGDQPHLRITAALHDRVAALSRPGS
jgi:hypothetical protein